MFFRLLLLFTVVPFVELILLIEAGKAIGSMNTIALVVLTGVLGAALARSQGFGIMSRIQYDLQQGQLPADSLMDGALVLAGALFLLTPGFITDFIGFTLLLPFTRTRLKRYLKHYFRDRLSTQEFHANYEVEE